MQDVTLSCPRCKAFIDPVQYNRGEATACLSCSHPLTVRVFPALFRPVEVDRGELRVDEEDAACFYHATKKAESICESCGRFVCTLCRLDMSGKVICPNCAATAQREGKAADTSTSRKLYDDMAISIACFQLLFWWIPFSGVLFTAVILYLAIRYWKEPLKRPVPRLRWKFPVAVLLSLFITAFNAAFYLALFSQAIRDFFYDFM